MNHDQNQMSNSSSAPPPLRTPSAGGGLRTASMAEDGKRACSDGSTVSAATERSYFDVDKPTSGGAAPASAVVALTGGGAAPASAVVALTGGGAATLDWAYGGQEQAVPLSSLIDAASARAPSMSGGNSSAVAVVGGLARMASVCGAPPRSFTGGGALACMASVGGAPPPAPASFATGGGSLCAPSMGEGGGAPPRSFTGGGSLRAPSMGGGSAAFSGSWKDMSNLAWGDIEVPASERSASEAVTSSTAHGAVSADPRSASAPN